MQIRRPRSDTKVHGRGTPACDQGATNRSLRDVADQTREGQAAPDLETFRSARGHENPKKRGVLGEKDFNLPKPSPVSKETEIQAARLPGKRRTAKAATSQTLRPEYKFERNHLLLTNYKGPTKALKPMDSGKRRP